MDSTKIMFNALSVAVFAIDKNHNVIIWNDACEELTGIKREEVIGTKNHWKGFYKEPRPCLVDFVLKKEKQIEGYYEDKIIIDEDKSIYKTESWFNLASGMKYLLIEARKVFDEHGNFLGVFEVLQDITKHKEIKDQVKLSASVFDHTTEGIIITDSENKIISANKAMEKLSGYKVCEMLGKNPKVFASNRRSNVFFKEMWTSLKKYGFWQGEFWNKSLNEQEYLVRALSRG